MNTKKDCYDCKHAGCDPDGPYCGHSESFKQTMYGRGFNMMRNEAANPDTAVCGSAGKFFEAKGE